MAGGRAVVLDDEPLRKLRVKLVDSYRGGGSVMMLTQRLGLTDDSRERVYSHCQEARTATMALGS